MSKPNEKFALLLAGKESIGVCQTILVQTVEEILRAHSSEQQRLFTNISAAEAFDRGRFVSNH